MITRSHSLVAAVAALTLTAGLVSAVAAHADEPDPSAAPSITTSPAPETSSPPVPEDAATPAPADAPMPGPAGTPGPEAPAELPSSLVPATSPASAFATKPGGAPTARLIAGPSSADAFSKAVAISGWLPSVQFDSRAATVEAREPRAVLGGHTISRTMWAKWAAPANGVITVSVGGGSSAANPAINVYVGTTLTKLTRVGSNDQQFAAVGATGSPGNSGRILSLKVRKGTIYRFQVGSSTFPGIPGDDGYASLTLSITGGTFDLPNDALADAQPLVVDVNGQASATTFLSGARMEWWEPYDNPVIPARPRLGSVWYSWTAPVDGTVVLATCTPLRSTTIVAYTSTHPYGSDAGDLSQVGFSEPNSSPYCGSQLGDRLQLPVQAGHLYRFQVSTLANVTEPSVGETTLTMDAFFDDPWIAKMSPASGPTKGGNIVTILGKNLVVADLSTSVRFGTKSGTIISVTSTAIKVRVPATSRKGRVSVVVFAEGLGYSNTGSYTYK